MTLSSRLDRRFLFSEIQIIDELYVTVGSPLSSLPIRFSRGRDVPLCIMLRLMDARDRIFPRGPMGTLYREFLAQLECLSESEVLLLCELPTPELDSLREAVSGLVVDPSLDRLIEIVQDQRIPTHWRASAASRIARENPTSRLKAIPALQACLSEFPTGPLVDGDVWLLFEAARTLCSMGPEARCALQAILAWYDDPRIKAFDRSSCLMGSVVYRVHLLPELLRLAPADERVISLLERCFYDEDGELHTHAPRFLVDSEATRERVRQRLEEAQKESFYTPEVLSRCKSSTWPEPSDKNQIRVEFHRTIDRLLQSL
jgi:hypothetical protein